LEVSGYDGHWETNRLVNPVLLQFGLVWEGHINDRTGRDGTTSGIGRDGTHLPGVLIRSKLVSVGRTITDCIGMFGDHTAK
jgi:hypothetical protein